MSYLNKTRLVEEVPGVRVNERFFIWHNRKIVWEGRTKEEGYRWAKRNKIVIETFEPFEP